MGSLVLLGLLRDRTQLSGTPSRFANSAEFITSVSSSTASTSRMVKADPITSFPPSACGIRAGTARRSVEILCRIWFSVKWLLTVTSPCGWREGQVTDQGALSRHVDIRTVDLSTARVICWLNPTGVSLLSLRGTVVQRDQLKRCEATVMNNEFDMESDWITELGKARSDEFTEKILAFVQELEKSAPEPFLPLLTDLALARALIVHLVIRYGPERGMAEARDAFESTLGQMKPMLERMKPRKGPPS
jgi:hypothetical protein